MSQDKDDKSKTSIQPPGPAVDPAIRPYATIDLKATDVAAAKSELPKTATPKGVMPPSTGSRPAGAATGGASTPGGTQPATAAPSNTGTKPVSPGAASAGARKIDPAQSSASAPSAVWSWLPSLISGAVGAVLALLGLGSLGLIGGDQTSGAMSGPLADRLAALERSSTAQPGADVAKHLAAADARLAAVEAAATALANHNAQLTSDAKSLADRLAGQSPVAAAAIERVEKLEHQLGDLAAAAANDPQRGRIPALAQITTRLGDLDTQITTRAASLKAELSQEMEKRLAATSETAETARARLAQRTQNLETTIKSVADDTTALRTTVEGLKTDLDTRLKATAKPADVAAAIAPVTTKVDGLSRDLATVVRSEQVRNATAGNVLLALELGNLKRAIDRGGNYAAELAAVQKAGGGKLNLAVLETAQSQGLPNLAALTKAFNSLAYTMLDAEADPADGSVLDRMLAGARSIVRIRKVVHAAGDTGTEATIGRMEIALKDGRLGEVLDLSKKLADKPLAIAAPWLKKIEARHAIETALADLDQSLKNALAGSSVPQKGGN